MPEYYKSKISCAALLAPVASLYHQEEPLLRWVSEEKNLDRMIKDAERLNVLNWFPHGALTTDPELAFCALSEGKFCELFLQMIVGDTTDTDDYTRRNVMLSQLPTGSGAYNTIHYGQFIHLDKETFRRFDYESDELNMKHYNQTTPPDYNL
jgi:hypothetical protein